MSIKMFRETHTPVISNGVPLRQGLQPQPSCASRSLPNEIRAPERARAPEYDSQRAERVTRVSRGGRKAWLGLFVVKVRPILLP